MFPLKERRISGYRWKQSTSYNAAHLGIDLQANYVNLFAPFNGNVERHDGTQGGITLWFYPDNGVCKVMRFMHLSKVIKTGRVNESDIIAVTGNTGSLTTNAHLHLDCSKTDSGTFWNNINNFIDPESINWQGADMNNTFTTEQAAMMYRRCLGREPENTQVTQGRGFEEMTIGIQIEINNRFTDLQNNITSLQIEVGTLKTSQGKYEKEITELKNKVKIYEESESEELKTANSNVLKLSKEITDLNKVNKDLLNEQELVSEKYYFISKDIFSTIKSWFKK